MPDHKKKKVTGKAKANKTKKEYDSQVSKRAERMEKDGRMQAARDRQLKKDVEKAGGKRAFLKQEAKRQKNFAKRRPVRRAYESSQSYEKRIKAWKVRTGS